ncbi:DUF2933 domain-containing protein [Streptomyces sp. GC420]|uniref:DUF2933 domain-containing protein n=1 Tax=Streptomyces sp. GC420 TaxID=2697568 RepID=UPI001414EAC2|nr:DUF2933 domain-containing protein [Streptomyces sp. GC420]NBM14451.1 DUF2933 domain-containing protein [Streptomyces sp. GC420]
MNDRRNYGMYALAAAIVVVGALIVGASLDSLVWLALVAACPLMMFFMMRGMRGQSMQGGRDQHHNERDEDPSPSSSSRGDPMRKHDHPSGPGRA